MQISQWVCGLLCLALMSQAGDGMPSVLLQEHSRVAESEVLQRPLHDLPDFAGLDEDQIEAFFGVGTTEELSQMAPALEIPSEDEIQPGVPSAIEFLERNRTSEHKQKYQLVADGIPPVPRSGFLLFKQSGEAPGYEHHETWAIPLDHKWLIYFSESRPQSADAQAPLRPAMRLEVLPLSGEMRDQFASMLWNLAHVKSKPIGAEGKIDYQAWAYDGQASLQLVNAGKASTIYQCSRWFSMERFFGERWRGAMSHEVAASWTGEFLAEHGGRLLKSHTNTPAIDFMAWASAYSLGNPQRQDAAKRELAMQSLMNLIEASQVPDEVLYVAARVAMPSPFSDWRAQIKARVSEGKSIPMERAREALRLAESKLRAKELAAMIAAAGPYSGWAMERTLAAEVEIQAEVFEALWVTDEEPWVLEQLAKVAPERARALYVEADEPERYLAVYFSRIAREDELMQGGFFSTLVSAIEDEDFDDQSMAMMLECFANPQVVKKHPEFFEKLQTYIQELHKKDSFDMSALYSRAFVALLAYPQAKAAMPALLQHLDHTTLEPCDERYVLDALCRFAEESGARPAVVEFFRARLLNNPGRVDDLISLLVKHDFSELLPIIERMATANPEEKQSIIALTGMTASRYPAGKFSFHAARQARALWAALDPEQKPRVLCAATLLQPELFYDDGITPQGAKLINELSQKTEAATQAIQRLRRSSEPRVVALLKAGGLAVHR